MKPRSSFLAALATLALASYAGAFPQSGHPAMTDPSKAAEKAPDTFRAKFETTKGDIVFECTREWAPNGVDRFYNLVKIGFFDDVGFFRVVPGFVVQWGIHGDPKVAAVWGKANLPPDPPKQSNKRGTLTYAMAGRPDTRSTQLFINYGDNANLDQMGFAPICKVAEGMEIAEKLYSGYNEQPTSKQGEITTQGNAYLKQAWPNLDYIKTATIVGEAPSPARSAKPEDKTDGKADTTDEGDRTILYVIGAIVVGGVAVFAFTRKKEEEPPAKKGKPSSGREKPRDKEREPKSKREGRGEGKREPKERDTKSTERDTKERDTKERDTKERDTKERDTKERDTKEREGKGKARESKERDADEDAPDEDEPEDDEED